MTTTSPPVTHITRVLAGVTSIFRCRGLNHVSESADNLGGHDLLYWFGFLALLTGWFLFIYTPQCRKYEALVGRQESLTLQLDNDKKELARLQRGISSLKEGEALAWERAARERMGWVEPGEITDLNRWRQTHPQAVPRPVSTPSNPAPAPQTRSNPQPRNSVPAAPSKPGPLPPRPAIPRLPRGPVLGPPAIAGHRQDAFHSVAGEAPLAPPPLPPLPLLPLHPLSPNAPRVAIARIR